MSRLTPAFGKSSRGLLSFSCGLASMLSSLLAVTLLATPPLPASQDQQPTLLPKWPCGGRVDPTYVRGAEATGGKVLLFHPTEVAGASADILASMHHEEVVFRAGGQLADGLYEYDIPLDSAIQSAYFFVSLQCLQIADITRPSGEELRSDAADVEYHQFEAIRMFVVKAPSPGIWKVRVGGKGVFSLVVTAQTDLQLTNVAFKKDDVPVIFSPKEGTTLRLEVHLIGAATQVGFQLITRDARPIQAVDLALEETSGLGRSYGGEVIPKGSEFRLAVIGIDEKGFRFQRIQRQLLIAER